MSKMQETIKNRTIFCGDNIDMLRGFNSDSIDLIYLDPPFNKKQEFIAPIGSSSEGASFKDVWGKEDIKNAWLSSIKLYNENLYNFLELSRFIGDFSNKYYLIYMTIRLIELHRILKPSGLIYFHCDNTMSHFIKLLMDVIFGANNFLGEIIWKRTTSAQKGSQHDAKTWGTNNDFIYSYSKSKSYRLNTTRNLTQDEMLLKFKLSDENGNRYYDDSSHIWRTPNMGVRPNLCYEWRGYTSPHPSGWRLSKERLEEEYQKGNIVILPNGKLQRRKYLRDYKGVPIGNLWTDINPPTGIEYQNYPTQKPLALLERIISSSCPEDGVVLDPFCGCATTCIASERLKRQWIGIDISDKAFELVQKRLKREVEFEGTVVNHLESIKVEFRTDVANRTDVEVIKLSSKVKENIKAYLFDKQAGRCNGCGDKYRIEIFDIDHITPKSKGGLDTEDNLQLLCSYCNRVKGNRDMAYLHAKLNETKDNT